MRLNWNASRKNGRRGRRMEKHITMSGRDKVTVDFQAKSLNLVYVFRQCKSTFKRTMEQRTRSACCRHRCAVADRVAARRRLMEVESRCREITLQSSTQLLSIHRPFLTEQACTLWAVTFIKFLKPRGDLYTGPVFSACLLPFLHSTPCEFYRYWAKKGYLDTWTHS